MKKPFSMYEDTMDLWNLQSIIGDHELRKYNHSVNVKVFIFRTKLTVFHLHKYEFLQQNL